MIMKLNVIKKLGSIMLLLFITDANAIKQYNVAYRADSRDIAQIREATGMWPFPGEIDDNLLHHFEGESVDDQVSAFVSTTSSIAQAVRHAGSLAWFSEEERWEDDFETYIYVIRPSSFFYDVDGSLYAARESVPRDSEQYARLDTIIRDYCGMDELAAHHGFNVDRIISYARLTGAMLNEYGLAEGSPLLSDVFWSSRWRDDGTVYNHDYDGETSNSAAFNMTESLPGGSRLMVRNGDQPDVPIGFSCSALSDKNKISKESGNSACTGNENYNLFNDFYDKAMLYLLTQ